MNPILPGYQITESLHSGVRTVIYRGYRESDGLPVIVKTLKAEYPTLEDITRLRHEYKILQPLNIQGIVRPYSLEKCDRRLALILEDLGANSLKSFIDAERLSVISFLTIAIQLASALAGLHQKQIIHKDIKPQNIIISQKTGQAEIIDFSISSQLARETSTLSHPDLLEGTLAYMSPEQTGRMNRSIDYRSDFYSLGITFYEMLIGELPFNAIEPLELVHSHIAKMPVPPHHLDPEIPEAISNIVMKLLAKNAEDRYQSAEGLKFDLETCLMKLKTTGKIDNFTPGSADKAGQLLIPQKIYGREAEVAALLKTFDRIASGTTELMLVSGYSGIGKTVLVNEVHKPIVRQRGYFIAGKFDQFKRDIPYDSLIQAFQSLILQLLTENAEQIKIWQEKLLLALSVNGQIIIDVIPEVELIIGKQPPVPELGTAESQNRFNRVFNQFISVFTAKEHPLVVFLDDLQWADSASLKLIELLMTDTDNQYLLLIGAYRDNEVFPAHPTIQSIEKIHSSGATVNNIVLGSLQLFHVEELIADTFDESVRSKLLAELLFNKTQGNPFFLTQLLKTLYQEDLLTYNLCSGVWQWNIEQIQAIGIIDLNVVDLIARNIRKLPTDTQKVLKLAACIGNTFNLEILSIVNEESSLVTAAQLWLALQAGLILPQGNEYKIPLVLNQEESGDITLTDVKVDYKFLHDRVQQAAYSLIPDDEKKETHLKIGQLLLQNTTPEEQKENIFAIVNQLNYGTELLVSESQKYKLAQLNLIAAQKAKAATAYASAIKYLNVGLALLSSDSWAKQYDLTLSLYVEAVATEYLNTNFERAAKLSNIVLENARDLLEKIPVYEKQIQFYIAQNQMKAAIDTALETLILLGEPLPEMPEDPSILVQLLDPKNTLDGKSIEDLAYLPQMSDSHKIAALRILITVMPSVFVAAPHLCPLIILKMIDLCVKYGNSLPSTYAYTLYGLMLCGVPSEFKAAYQFCQLSLKLLEQMNAKEFKAKVYAVYNFFVRQWNEHSRNTIEPFKEGINSALETGDIELACRGATFYCNSIFFMGEPLEQVAQEQNKYFILIQKYDQKFDIDYTRIWMQGVENLRDRLMEHPEKLSGRLFREETDLGLLNETQNHMALFSYYLLKGTLYFLFKNYLFSLEQVLLASQYTNSLAGMIHIAQTNLYYSLNLLALYNQVEPKQKEDYLSQVSVNQQWMQKWAYHAPENFQHKYELVEAEKARVLKQNEKAIDYYERAIQGASQQGYVQEEALANELAAEFHLLLGREKIAKTYMTDAYYAYVRWGATAKVEHLEKQYPQLLAPILNQKIEEKTGEMMMQTIQGSITSIGTGISEFLDLATVMKASQAISGEIVLDHLLDKLMRTLIENAGAQTGSLIFSKDGQFFIEAVGNKDEVRVRNSFPLSTSQQVPVSVINYVARTQKDVILNDASRESLFNTDSYILQHKTKSLLCTPILYQGKLTAILYLENNLTTGAFTPKRVEVLRMLSAQAAIALENAQLYANLETANQKLEDYSHTLEVRVEERTQQLQDKNLRLEVEIKERQRAEQAADAANRAKSQFLANMSHELRTPLNGILGYAQILKRDKNLTEQQNVGVKIIRQCGDHLLTLINDILDLSKIEAGKMELQPTEFQFSEFLESIAEICHIRAEQKKISLIYEPMTQLPTAIRADAKRLRQILINLLGNAVKFTETGGVTFKVGVLGTVGCEQEADAFSQLSTANPQSPITHHQLPTLKIRFQVEDTGIGVASEQLSKIFLPFEQVNNTAIQTEGTGLGLAISRQLVEMMGGELKVESSLGKGSIFWFDLELPVVKTWAQNQQKSEKIVRGFTQSNRKIIVVDDRWENRSVLVNLLTPIGFEVMEAIDGQDCLNKALSFQPDCIIIDLVMPVMDGFEATRRIRQLPELKNVVIIGVSASVLSTEQEGCLAFGCNDFVPKPIRAEQLLDCLSHHLKLEWTYEESEYIGKTALAKPSTFQVDEQEISVPPNEELAILFDLAMMGDLGDIQEKAKNLAPQYMRFATHLSQLAENFEEGKILDLLQSYMEPQG